MSGLPSLFSVVFGFPSPTTTSPKLVSPIEFGIKDSPILPLSRLLFKSLFFFFFFVPLIPKTNFAHLLTASWDSSYFPLSLRAPLDSSHKEALTPHILESRIFSTLFHSDFFSPVFFVSALARSCFFARLAASLAPLSEEATKKENTLFFPP